MDEFMSEEKEPESFLLICTYCEKFKNDDGYWEHLSISLKSSMEDRISHGICPQCFKKHFPEHFSSLCKERKIVVKKMTTPDNRLLYGYLYIVNNTGCLYGNYDKEQRL